MKGNLLSFSGSEAVRPFWSPLYHIEEVQRWLTGHEYSAISNHVLSLAAKSCYSAYNCVFAAWRNLRVSLITTDLQIFNAFPAVAVSPSAFVG